MVVCNINFHVLCSIPQTFVLNTFNHTIMNFIKRWPYSCCILNSWFNTLIVPSRNEEECLIIKPNIFLPLMLILDTCSTKFNFSSNQTPRSFTTFTLIKFTWLLIIQIHGLINFIVTYWRLSRDDLLESTHTMHSNLVGEVECPPTEQHVCTVLKNL